MKRLKYTRGIIAGVVIGALVGMAVSPLQKRDKRMIRRKASRAARAVSDTMSNIIDH